MLIQFYSVDAPFLDQFNIQLIAGRGLADVTSEAEQMEPILLTEKAVDMLDLGTPHEAIGQVFAFDSNPNPRRAVVTGVVTDFYTRGYERGYYPVVLRHQPSQFRWAAVQVRSNDWQATIQRLEATWKTLAPTVAFSYSFYDEQLARQYLFLGDVVKFFGLLSGFVVLIACLGLLAMASFTAETRLPEVGIRKVLGADVRSVLLLLSREYVVLVLIAVAIASPLAYAMVGALLQNFANRIALDAWIFMAGVLPVLALAVLTIGSQTLKAAYANPVDTLRKE